MSICFKLRQKVSPYKQLLKERDKKPHRKFKQNAALIDNWESENDSNSYENMEVAVAKRCSTSLTFV